MAVFLILLGREWLEAKWTRTEDIDWKQVLCLAFSHGNKIRKEDGTMTFFDFTEHGKDTLRPEKTGAQRMETSTLPNIL